LVEVSQVRRRLQAAIAAAREGAQRRRQRASEAETAYDTFLAQVATPLARQIANALQAEGYAFTLSTPGRGLRLALDRGRDDFIELALETDGDELTVIGRIRRTRGSRTLEEERPIRRGASPDQLSEQEVLDFFSSALEPWLER
jgi:hypothetical protein